MKPPSASHPNARDRQREETREQILRAVARQLEAGEMEDLSFAEVAKEAKVGERTVYRHFPTKEALLGAFWSWMQTQAQAQAQALALAPVERPRPSPVMPRIRETIKATRDAHRPMRILLATDAWEPQVNGVVRTLTRTVAECRTMGHEVEVISPDQFKTFPLPTYPEIKLAVGAYEPLQERFRIFEPEAIHIATEGPIGFAARRICVDWKLPFTTSYHTKFPEYVAARLPVPVQAGYAYMRWFHKPSGRLMVATPTMRDELGKHGFRNISPWSRGVDTEAFHPSRASDPSVYAGLERPIWLNVGRVAVEKNIE
ncbi:MAG TPA: glycosyltransferase, partial [Phenylobacterium sp.]|uniref:glycosyltransferase n=1 Tax=Phenylobacterium sp. TaxID=1871053 RepID=UPI002B4651EC